ncbi:Arginine--tRNA ligase [Labeo rohita]|uniref:Arginine--tRNA ligase n=1 Tax=Labeo rohita TaxID=84645 RepID=A0ABQ8M3X8_LABRO|nr:Arginine--tRNA ligase [Labeo rohita]
MDYNDGLYRGSGVGRSRLNDKSNKRVRSDDGDEYENDDDDERVDTFQKEIEEKYEVVIKFNVKNQENMKKVNPFVLTTSLVNKIGEIEFAKILNNGNLLVRCADVGQMERALKIKDIVKCKVESRGRVGTRIKSVKKE